MYSFTVEDLGYLKQCVDSGDSREDIIASLREALEDEPEQMKQDTAELLHALEALTDEEFKHTDYSDALLAADCDVPPEEGYIDDEGVLQLYKK